jgi:hypothetical protein
VQTAWLDAVAFKVRKNESELFGKLLYRTGRPQAIAKSSSLQSSSELLWRRKGLGHLVDNTLVHPTTLLRTN